MDSRQRAETPTCGARVDRHCAALLSGIQIQCRWHTPAWRWRLLATLRCASRECELMPAVSRRMCALFFFHCRNLAITCAQPIRRAAFGRIPVLSARGGPCGLAQSSAPLAVASLTARVFALGKRLADKMWGAPTYWAGRWQRPGKCLPWLSPPSGSVRRTPAVGPRGTGDEESTSIPPLMQRRSTF